MGAGPVGQFLKMKLSPLSVLLSKTAIPSTMPI